MNMNKYLDIAPEVQQALADGRPVVALESTIISHGMPYPQNVETALNVEKTIRDHGAVPATIAIIGGRLKAGLTPEESQAHPEIGYLAVPEIRWWWNVSVHGDRLLRFRCGESLGGELLMDWRAAASLECVMLRDKLARTLLTFTYEDGE